MSSENDEDLMFRLRTGHATFKNMSTGEVYISERMTGFDGECSLSDVKNFCMNKGFEILVLE